MIEIILAIIVFVQFWFNRKDKINRDDELSDYIYYGIKPKIRSKKEIACAGGSCEIV